MFFIAVFSVYNVSRGLFSLSMEIEREREREREREGRGGGGGDFLHKYCGWLLAVCYVHFKRV